MNMKPFILVMWASFCGTNLQAQGAVHMTSEKLILENQVVRMEVNRFGGAISSFMLKSNELNPYSWVSGRWEADDVSQKEGLFVCFDRIGSSSGQDKAAGMPFHGEATSVPWKVLETSGMCE